MLGRNAQHSLSFVFNSPKIPVEVGVLSKNKTKPRRRSPIHGIVDKHKYKHYLIEWEGKHIMFFLMYPDKKEKTLQVGLFIYLTSAPCGCDI